MQHVDHLLSAYIDNELDEQERLVVEKHLQDCADCLEVYNDFNWVGNQLAQSYATISCPNNVAEQLMRKIVQLEAFPIQENKPFLSYKTLRWGAISSIFLLIFVNISLSAIIGSIFSFTSFRIVYHLIHGLLTVFIAVPYLNLIASISCVLLIGISLWILRQLLSPKKVEIPQ